jgi:uncharacterized protein
MRILMWLMIIVALAYLVICAALFIYQRSLIYYPQPNALDSPSTKMNLPVTDANLVVSVQLHTGPKALIYFGGNAEDVSVSLPLFAKAFPDRSIYLLHYRGYGGSSGTPSEEKLHTDALDLFDMARREHQDIVVVGRSLGSGIAVRVASERPASRLVLITPYDSIQEVAARKFPYIPVRWLLRDKYESWRYASAIRAPTLLVMAERDEVIPRSSTERLYASFNKNIALLKIIPDVGHNTISNSPLYLEVLSHAR